MVPDKAIDLVDELLRDLHLRELNLEELANRIERSCNFTLGLMLEEQQTLGRLRQLLTPYEWCVGLPRLIRKWDAVQRAADKARPESCALGFSWTLDCERVLAGGVSR